MLHDSIQTFKKEQKNLQEIGILLRYVNPS